LWQQIPVLDEFVRYPGGPLNTLGWVLLVLGFLLAAEGVAWAASPQRVLRILLRREPTDMPLQLFRVFGATPGVIGIGVIIWVIASAQGHVF